MSVLSILATTLPIYLMMLAGGCARRWQWMPAETDRGLMQLTIRLLFPCLIFERIVGNPALADPKMVLLAATLGFGLSALGILLSFGYARISGMQNGSGARSFAISSGLQNYGFVAIPVTEALFGKDLIGVLFTFSIGVEFAMWTVGVGFLTGFHKAPWRQAINLPFIATITALIVHYAGWATYIPDPLHQTFATLGACAIPLSLLLVGGSIADLIGLEPIRWRTVTGSILMRNAVLPLLMIACALWIPMSEALQKVICVQAAMPSAVFTIVLARLYGGHTATSVLVVLATTFASLLSMPWIIQLATQWLQWSI